MKKRNTETAILESIKVALDTVTTATAKVREIRKARAKLEGGRP